MDPQALPPAVGFRWTGLERTATRTATLSAAAAYVIVYLAVYVLVVSPRFASEGLVNRAAGDGSLVVALALAALPGAWLPAAARRPSDVGLWIVYLTGFVPSVLMPALVLGGSWGLVPLWLTIGASFLVVVIVIPKVSLHLPPVELSQVPYTRGLVVLATLAIVAVVGVFGLPSGIPSLADVRSVRDDFREVLAGAGRLGGYAVWWTGQVLGPLLLAYGAWRRSGRLMALGLVLFLLIYAVAAFRSMAFLALLLVIVLLVRHHRRQTFGPTLTIVATVGMLVCALAAVAGWLLPVSLFVRRLVHVPGQVLAYYYDFFSTNPTYALSHSFLGGLTERPYRESPAGLIGRTYFGDPAVNANGNLWADGLANFGLPGIAAASVVLALVLVLMDAAARGKPGLVAVSVGGLAFWSVTNSGVLTSIMTHGLGVLAVLLWLLPRPGTSPPRTGFARVAHLTSVHRADDPRIYLKECRTLAAAGFEVSLVAGSSIPPTADDIDFISVGYVRNRALRMVLLPPRILRAALRLRADIVHLHDPELLPVGLVLKLLGARVVYDAHENLVSQVAYKTYLPLPIRRVAAVLAGVLERIAVRFVDAVVAATPGIAARFPPGKTVVVQNFPRADEFLEHEPQTHSSRPPIVAYVGRITEVVGGLIMADAARMVQQRRSARFVLAGPVAPEIIGELTKRAAEIGIELPGWLSRVDVRSLLDHARVGIVVFQPVTNYIDAYPTKLFEYMASAVPVVASDFPVWRDIVAGARCGVLVDPTNPEEVAAAINILLDDPEAAAAMGRRGREAVLAHYRWDSQGEKLVALYRRLASRAVEAPSWHPPTDGRGKPQPG